MESSIGARQQPLPSITPPNKAEYVKILKFVAVAMLLLASVSWSQGKKQKATEQTALEVATELADLMNSQIVEQLLEQSTQMTWPTFETALKGMEGVSKEKIDTIKAEFVKIEREYLKEILVEYPPIYARHFTASELKQMIAFYKSPVGRKTLTELPLLFAEIMPIISAKIPTLQSNIIEAFQKYLAKSGFSI